jgi:hypothetical protein
MDDAESLSLPSTAEQEPNLAYWKRRIAELPEIRTDKVQRTRALLQGNSYDNEQILDTTLDRVADDLGLRCSPTP